MLGIIPILLAFTVAANGRGPSQIAAKGIDSLSFRTTNSLNSSTNHRYLNPKTQSKPKRATSSGNGADCIHYTEFLVDGKSIPEVDFDIGESYAGLLPISNSTNSSLFFWFFPSENVAASEEVQHTQ